MIKKIIFSFGIVFSLIAFAQGGDFDLPSNLNKIKVENLLDTSGLETNLNKFSPRETPEIIIFISFSLPDFAVIQLVQEANKYNIPIVIRGLHKNSFPETAKKLFELLKVKNMGGVLINPEWFKQNAIDSVPAFKIGEDIVYGGTFVDAVRLVKERGSFDSVQIAEKFLEKVEK